MDPLVVLTVAGDCSSVLKVAVCELEERPVRGVCPTTGSGQDVLPLCISPNIIDVVRRCTGTWGFPFTLQKLTYPAQSGSQGSFRSMEFQKLCPPQIKQSVGVTEDQRLRSLIQLKEVIISGASPLNPTLSSTNTARWPAFSGITLNEALGRNSTVRPLGNNISFIVMSKLLPPWGVASPPERGETS